MLRVDRTAFFKNKNMCNNTTGTKEKMTTEDLESLIDKVKDHKHFVNRITDTILVSHYYLNEIQRLEASSYPSYQRLCRRRLNEFIVWLAEEDPKSYIDSIGPLFTLQNHIKARYEKEILTPKNTKSEA